MTVTSKVVATPNSAIEVFADYTNFELGDGGVHRVMTSRHADFDLHFTTVRDYRNKNDKLFTIIKEE